MILNPQNPKTPGGTNGARPRLRRRIKGLLVPVVTISLIGILTGPVSAYDPVAGGACAVRIHQHVVSLAAEHTPTSLHNSIRVQLNPMKKRIAALHEDPSLLGAYPEVFQGAVQLAQARNRRKYPEMAGLLADASYFVFERYRPKGLDTWCDRNDLEAQASFLYDGFDLSPDYGAATSAFPKTGAPDGDLSVPAALNRMINETIDLWIVVWKTAGRRTTGQPERQTLVRGSARPPFLSFLGLDEARSYARKAFGAGDHASAAEVLGEIIAAAPGDRSTIYELAVSLYGIGRYDESLEQFRKIPDIRDVPFYTGILLHRQGDESLSPQKQMEAYYESFRLLEQVEKVGGEHANETRKILTETAEHLLELYAADLSDSLNDAKRQLELAELSRSKTHRTEFETMMQRIGKRVEEYGFIRTVTRRLSLTSRAIEDFDPQYRRLEKRGRKLAARPAPAEPKKAAAAKKPKKVPSTAKKATPPVPKKPVPAPASPRAPKPKAVPTPAPVAVAAVPAPTPAPVVAKPEPAGEDKFDAYLRKNDMKPAIAAFKAGYHGKSCGKVRRENEKDFRKVAREDDAIAWARHQESYCQDGKNAKAGGARYYNALSEFLGRL